MSVTFFTIRHHFLENGEFRKLGFTNVPQIARICVNKFGEHDEKDVSREEHPGNPYFQETRGYFTPEIFREKCPHIFYGYFSEYD